MIVILGEEGAQGVYLLHIRLAETIALTFGRFARGRTFQLPAGDYLYVGSAMARRGATTLAGRLLRHASRSGCGLPHPIRPMLYANLAAAALASKLPGPKRCHWHIDYLLDREEATLTAVYALRTVLALEAPLARRLMAAPETAIPIPRLGAGDDRGATHLLQVHATTDWWARLPTMLHVLATTSQERL